MDSFDTGNSKQMAKEWNVNVTCHELQWSSDLKLKRELCKKHSVSLEVGIKTEKRKTFVFMSPDRLEEWVFCEGKELVVLTRLCCGSLVRKCLRTCDTKRQWKLSEFGARCLLPASCSMFCFLVFWNPSIQSLPAPGSARDPSQTALAEVGSDALVRGEHCRAFPQPCLPSPPTSCSHLPAPLWPGQGEDFSLHAFPAGRFHSVWLICIRHPCCLEGLHLLS